MIRRYWFVPVLLAAVILGACAPSAASPTDTLLAPTQTAAPTLEAPTQAVPTSAPGTTAEPTAEVVDCQPYTLLSQVLPAPDPNLAPVDAEDHVLGPSDALVTILEFSDYQ